MDNYHFTIIITLFALLFTSVVYGDENIIIITVSKIQSYQQQQQQIKYWTADLILSY